MSYLNTRHGSYEIFFREGEEDETRGWYWWPCFPGCDPHGEAQGPFLTERDARNDVKEGETA